MTTADHIKAIVGTDRAEYVPNHGNAGDAVIACATQQILAEIGVEIVEEAETVIVAGGGNLIRQYNTLAHSIKRIKPHKRIVILPSSVDREKMKFLHDLQAGQSLKGVHRDNPIHLMCREENTYRLAQEFGIQASRCHDLAFSLDFASTDPAGNDLLIAYRKDSESVTSSALKADSRDISLEFPQQVWRLDEESRKVAMAFIGEIAKYQKVFTDRLHVAIVAARMGRKVTMRDNSYGKVSGVYLASMQGFKNVRFTSDFSTMVP